MWGDFPIRKVVAAYTTHVWDTERNTSKTYSNWSERLGQAAFSIPY